MSAEIIWKGMEMYRCHNVVCMGDRHIDSEEMVETDSFPHSIYGSIVEECVDGTYSDPQSHLTHWTKWTGMSGSWQVRCFQK